MNAVKAIAASLLKLPSCCHWPAPPRMLIINTFGNPKAPLLIEVFSDFECPACKYFHDNEFQKIHDGLRGAVARPT